MKESTTQKFRRLHPGYDKQYYKLFLRRHPGYHKDRYAADPRASKVRSQAWNRQLKLEVLLAYGGKCACCAETEPGFLTVDHISGGGRKERQTCGGNFYNWLRKRGWPKKGYRLLCMNCNFAIGRYGICPHVDPNVLSRTTYIRKNRKNKMGARRKKK